MGAAARLTVEERKEVVDGVEPRRDRLADGLVASIPDTYETAERNRKVAGNCHVCFDGIESEALLYLLEQSGIMASAASSCASGAQDPSHVLAAIGMSRQLAGGSLRLSLGATTTDDDIDRALEALPDAVARLRLLGS
jgi:cysteine desulfurase